VCVEIFILRVRGCVFDTCEICLLGRLGRLEGLGSTFLRVKFKIKNCACVVCVTCEQNYKLNVNYELMLMCNCVVVVCVTCYEISEGPRLYVLVLRITDTCVGVYYCEHKYRYVLTAVIIAYNMSFSA